jgi:hypothetical protein
MAASEGGAALREHQLDMKFGDAKVFFKKF